MKKIHVKLLSTFLLFSHYKMIIVGKIHVCSILNVLFQDMFTKMTKSPMFRKSDAKHINFVFIPLYHFITSLLN